MRNLFQDVRYGARMFAKTPGFTITAVLALAVGIGANTTIFSFVNALLLRSPAGIAEPGRVVGVYTSDFSSGLYGASSFPDFLDYCAQSDAFEGLAAFQQTVANLSAAGDEMPERSNGVFVTGGYFQLLGVRAARGRLFSEAEDDRPDAPPALVISHSMWQRRFGSDPSAVGSTLNLDGKPYTIVGVADESFRGTRLGEPPDFRVPARMIPERTRGARGNRGFELVGRLRAGVTTEQAQAQLQGVAARLAQAYPDTNLGTLLRPDQPRPVTVAPESLIGPAAREKALMVSGLLLGVVGLVLLIACANVANLLLARASVRRREIAIRLALGAGRARLVRQLMTESVMLALAGGAGGLVAAIWTRDLLPAFSGQADLALLDLSPDARVLGFTLALSLVTGVVFGLVPALQSSRPDLVAALKDDPAGATGRLGRLGLRDLLVVTQVALSLVLLIGAGLFLRSLRNAVTFDPGFDARNMLLASLEIRGVPMTPEQGQLFYRELQERVGRLPGVRAASLTRVVPVSGGGQRRGIQIEGYQPRAGEDTELNTNVVAGGYFAAMQIPLVEGRDFDGRDSEKSPGVVVVNEEFAGRYFPGQSALGRRLKTESDGPPLEIVGVARTTKHRSLREQPLPIVYIPLAQEYQRGMTLVVRTEGDPLAVLPAVRGVMQGLDKNLPLYGVKTMSSHVSEALAADRMIALLLGVFGAAALLLACVGLYGVMSYTVAQRTHEIGVRLALGARGGDILRLVVGQGMVLVAAGAGVGLALAFALTRLLAGLLFGVSTTDPATFAGITLLLAGVALLACYLPARRATRIDPMLALRYE